MEAIRIKPGGTPDIEGWTLGEVVRTVGELKPGMHVLDVSEKFNAQNLAVVTRVGNEIVEPDKLVYARFVSPVDGQSPRTNGDHEFAIWDFMVGEKWRLKLYHVERVEQAVSVP